MDQFTNTGTRVRQIAQFPLWDSLAGGELALIQRGGVGGVYASITVADLVGWGLASGGGPLRLAGGAAIRWNGNLPRPLELSAGPNGFLFGGPVNVQGNLDAVGLSVSGQPVATYTWVQQSFDYLKANTVASFNGRSGAVTLMLKDVTQAGAAPNNNPHLTGVCQAPTPWDVRLCNDQIATTCWVQNLLATQPWACSPYLQGAPTVTTPPAGDYSKRITNTIWVTDALLDLEQKIVGNAPDLSAYAPLDSPAFTGVPTGPTAAPGTNTTELATTAFVTSAVVASTTGVASWNGRTGAVTLTPADITAAGGVVASGVVTTFNGRAGAVGLTTSDITGAGGFPTSGGTMTGSLAIVPAGSDAQITIEGPAGHNGTLWLDKKAAGTSTQIITSVNDVVRWNLQLGNTAAESGGNAGSDLVIARYSDSGALLDTPMTIVRATGQVLLAIDPVQPLGAATKNYVDTHAASGGLVAFNVYGSSQTIAIPAGATKAIVEMWGSSGGSGAAINSGYSGATGSGGFLRKFLTGLTPGNTLVFALGAAGAGGVMSGTTPGFGTAAGSTTLTSGTQVIPTLTCPGTLGSVGADGVQGAPTAGGVPTGGDLNVPGQSGMFWQNDAVPPLGPTGGHSMYAYGADTHFDGSGTGSSGNPGHIGGLQVAWYS
jgi:hypothetical protein